MLSEAPSLSAHAEKVKAISAVIATATIFFIIIYYSVNIALPLKTAFKIYMNQKYIKSAASVKQAKTPMNMGR